MLKRIFAGLFLLSTMSFVPLTVLAAAPALIMMAAANNNNNGGQEVLPQATHADLMFLIDGQDIKYRSDGHMLVCYDAKQGNFFNRLQSNFLDRCNDSSSTRTLEEFWKAYFPQAPNMKMVGMSYSAFRNKYIFWLKR